MLYIDTARKHDLTALKENIDNFSKRLKGKIVIADKGYVSKDFTEEMEKRGTKFIPIKRKNMIGEDKMKYYQSPSKLRKIIKTLFPIANNFGLKFIKAVSRKDLAVKLILSLSFNIYQLIR